MPDVFDLLAADHAEVKQLLERFETLIAGGRTTPELIEEGGALADTLISNSSQHEAAEEEHFWPAVKQRIPQGDSLAATAIDQESEAKKALARLDGMAPDDGQFIPLISKLIQAGRAHIDYEEQQVWPAFRDVLSADEANELGDKVAQAKEKAPTRPHPHTPANPAVLKTAGPAVAAVDKARDAASHRQN